MCSLVSHLLNPCTCASSLQVQHVCQYLCFILLPVTSLVCLLTCLCTSNLPVCHSNTCFMCVSVTSLVCPFTCPCICTFKISFLTTFVSFYVPVCELCALNLPVFGKNYLPLSHPRAHLIRPVIRFVTLK